MGSNEGINLAPYMRVRVKNQTMHAFLELKSEKNNEIGFLSAQKEPSGLKFCEKTAGEIFIFHSMLADIRKIELAPIGLYLTTIDRKTYLVRQG